MISVRQYPNLDIGMDFDLLENFQENWEYYTGKTAWKNWIGPNLKLDSNSDRRTMDEVRRVFQSFNIIQPVVNRHMRSLVGLPYDWKIVTEQGDYEGDADELIKGFLRHQRTLPGTKTNYLQQATLYALCHPQGKGYLRVYSPVKLNKRDGMSRLAIHAPSPDTVIVERDGDEFIRKITYSYWQDEVGWKERQFLDDNGVTRFEIFKQNKLEKQFGLNLGDRYSIYEISLSPLISDSLKRNQNAINHALTMMVRNSEFSGFLRDIILNGQPPGKWDIDQQGNEVFIPSPEPMPVGPGIINYVQGNPLYDAQGQLTGYTSPSLSTHEPTSPQAFIDSIRFYTSLIYEQTGQTFVLGNDLPVSGISRQQSRADFIAQLQGDAELVADAISNVYLTVLLMGNQKSSEDYLDLSVTVTPKLSINTPTAEEQTAIRQDYAAGLLSRRTAIALQGQADADTELNFLIKEETAPTVELSTQV